MIWLVGSLDALRADGFGVADGVLQDYLQTMAIALATSAVTPQSLDPREPLAGRHDEMRVPIQAPHEVHAALAALAPTTPQPLLIPCTLSLPSLATLGALLPVGWTDHLVQRCRDVAGLRAWVAEQDAGLGVLAGQAQVGWLPLIVTARGVLYGEAIAADPDFAAVESQRTLYRQPWHLNDRQRQQLYGVGRSLVTELNLPWGVHLMQFRGVPRSSDSARVTDSPADHSLAFDRLYPYPGPPALASCGRQEPDLLSCHRACVLGQPVRDVVIASGR